MTDITVHKLDAHSNYVLSYIGRLVERGETWICIKAVFDHDDAAIGEITLNRGDIMTEWFYSDRYYNVFKLEGGKDQRPKGWYCNITRPACIDTYEVLADDLALDIVVDVDGEITILDEDELAALHLPDEEVSAVWDAVDQIKQLVTRREGPFRA